MQSNWDSAKRMVIADDGTRQGIPYLTNDDQIARWSAFGFDIQGAVKRHRAMKTEWKSAKDIRTASNILARFYRGEALIAIEQGVPNDDPDKFMIDVAHKAFWWEAPVVSSGT